MRKTVHVIVSGRVQGVGYRAFTEREAKRTGLDGWVRNRADGAVEAVVKRRTSLLPAGLTAVEGHFSAGDPVDLVDPEGRAVARGLVNFDAEELPRLLGRSTRELAAELGPAYEREVVHRDDLVLL